MNVWLYAADGWQKAHSHTREFQSCTKPWRTANETQTSRDDELIKWIGQEMSVENRRRSEYIEIISAFYFGYSYFIR